MPTLRRHRLAAHSPPDRADTVTPVFILGVAHSGTSLLYNMLARHPATTWFSQWSLRAGAVPGRRAVPGALAVDRALRRVTRHDWRKHHLGMRSRLTPYPIEAWEFWEHFFEGDRPIDDRAARLHAALVRFSVSRHREYFVGKAPRFLRHLDALSRVSHRSQHVHIIRDGRAAVLSLRGRLFADVPDDDDALIDAASYWVRSVCKFEAVDGSKLSVRYEDLCADVYGTLTCILERVGLSVRDMPFDALPARLTSTNRSLAEHAGPKAAARVLEIQSEVLDRYGYA